MMTETFHMTARWADKFIGLAQHVATWSKDPSTQVGAVLVDRRMRVIGMGYNGFPRGYEAKAEGDAAPAEEAAPAADLPFEE